jgi:sugar lactone lactonase YvrE
MPGTASARVRSGTTIENELWWVDISGKRLHRWRPASGQRRTGRSTTSLGRRAARAGRPAARDARRALFHGPEHGRAHALRPHEPDRPDNRTNEAKCAPDGSFWVGTMQNNLHPDGSAKAMTGSPAPSTGCATTAAITREVDGVGLSNTLAWTDGGKTLLFADTGTGVIRAFEVKPDGRLGVSPASSTTAPGGREAAGLLRRLGDRCRGFPCGTRASPGPA